MLLHNTWRIENRVTHHNRDLDELCLSDCGPNTLIASCIIASTSLLLPPAAQKKAGKDECQQAKEPAKSKCGQRVMGNGRAGLRISC